MKLLIIEDEPATAKRLEKMLAELLPEARNMGIIDTVEESIVFFQKNTEPDLVFMDIHLADGNSFEIFEKVEINCPVIFTTAYDQYAIKAFKVNSIDYLLKPIKQPELVKSLKKFQKNITPAVFPDYKKIAELLQSKPDAGLKRIVVKIGQSIKALEVSEIAYFVVENKTVYAVPKTGSRLPVEFTMDFLEKELDTEQFFRVNRSIIISFDAINSMFSYSKSRIKILLKPECSDDVVTSSERTSQFKEWLKGK
ncbi:MAG TPA: LytTR family DNA-binding domain-containing protein [Bacteroidales bacterium]